MIPTYTAQAEVIRKSYLNVADIQKLIPVGKAKARQIMREVREEMIKENIPIFNYHLLIAPTERVLNYLHLDADLIQRESKRY